MTFGQMSRALDEGRREIRRGVADLYLELRATGTPAARRAQIMGLLAGLEAALVGRGPAAPARGEAERSAP